MLKTNWYAVHTLSQSELKVKTYIEKTKLERNMDEKIYEIILRLIPESFIKNILSRVDRMETESEVILLAEEFIN